MNLSLEKIRQHKTVSKIINHRHWQKYEKYVSLVIWLLAIFYFSSKSLDFVALVDIWEVIIRKIVHMFEFAVLAYLIFRILGQTEKRHVNWNLFWTLAFTVLYAFSDEYHQSLTPGRVASYKDVLIDSVGALVAIWLLYLDYHHKKYLARKKRTSV